MKKDKHTTDIIFRVDKSKDFKGTVFALFPHECNDLQGHVVTYQHIGQHSAADYNYCIQNSIPAKESEYSNLKIEMEGLGYNIKVVSRQSRSKFLQSYKQAKR